MIDVSDLTQEEWDPLHRPRRNTGHWTTTNVGEALPGVPTPLGWSMWASTQQSVRVGFYAIGVLSRLPFELQASTSRDDLFKPGVEGAATR